jgi:hypothetical protein
MTCVAIDICPSFLVAVQTPLHIVSVNHFYRSLFQTRKPVTDGAIDTALDVNPVGKNDMSRKLIHSLPRNLLACLHILNDF